MVPECHVQLADLEVRGHIDVDRQTELEAVRVAAINVDVQHVVLHAREHAELALRVAIVERAPVDVRGRVLDLRERGMNGWVDGESKRVASIKFRQ